MDNLKFLLSSQEQQSAQVQSLLACLSDPSFNLDVYIASVGGVGSTALSNFLTRHGLRCNLLTDQDSIRHTNRPPMHGSSLCTGTCVIYLFGDPLPSICSHYRRGHACHQAQKTSGNARLRPEEFPATFDDYVGRAQDLFGYEAHLRNWLTSPTTFDILFVRYETMYEPCCANTLFEHICSCTNRSLREAHSMAAEFVGSKVPRKSRVMPEQREAMYVGFQQQIDDLPRVFIRDKAGFIHALVSTPAVSEANSFNIGMEQNITSDA